MSKPIKTFRCGVVSVAIWSDQKTVEGNQVTFHHIKFEKAYWSENGWKYTTSFSPEDLPNVALLADEAYKFLKLNHSESQADDDSIPI